MYVAHGASAPPAAAHASALALALCFVMLAIPPGVLVFYGCREARRRLRACPLCSAAAVRGWAYEDLGCGRVRIDVQCGQCGVWRRTVAGDANLERHERAVRRDRRRMGDLALRLAARRIRHESHAFTTALRSEVRGADDFLARTRACAAAPRRDRRRPA